MKQKDVRPSSSIADANAASLPVADVIARASKPRVLRPISSSRVRWNWLWLALTILVSLLPLLVYVFTSGAGAACDALFGATVGGNLTIFAIWLCANVFSIYHLVHLQHNMGRDYRALYPP